LPAGVPEVDFARIALEIARDHDPDIDLEYYLGWIGDLTQRVRDRCPSRAEPIKILNQINWAVFVEEGFRGNCDDYYDPRNSYLNEVIDRKTGIPISLCILYRAIAERLGLELPGVNLPAHFMLKHESAQGTLFIDAFHGDLLDQRGCERRLSETIQQPVRLNKDQVAACPPRLVIARMLRNLKAIHLQQGDLLAVIAIQRRLAAIHLDVPQEQRELGLLCLQLGRLDEAVGALQRFLDVCVDRGDASIIESLLRDARREIVLRN
jgi:regulator of sirC expression with transglutaminase-like and TPR domain